MKWFKHYANAHTNNLIQSIIMERGLADAMRYWLLLELLCEEFDKNTTIFIVSNERLKSALRIRHDSKLSSFIQFLTKSCASFDQDLIKFQIEPGKFWKIKTPIILELMGREFKRTGRSPVIATPKKKEERTKKENNPQTPKRGLSGISERKALEAKEIISYWNAQEIVIHGINDNLVKSVASSVKRKKISASEIMNAIKNYNYVLKSPKFKNNFKWTLKEFLKREAAEKYYVTQIDPNQFIINSDYESELTHKETLAEYTERVKKREAFIREIENER